MGCKCVVFESKVLPSLGLGFAAQVLFYRSHIAANCVQFIVDVRLFFPSYKLFYTLQLEFNCVEVAFTALPDGEMSIVVDSSRFDAGQP